ncbi:hypothetical protein RCL1_006441 [Eukaryota sp. TZLM3-RCL]
MPLLQEFLTSYKRNNDARTRIVDLFILFHVSMLVITLFYGLVFGSFPFNSYMSAVFTCLGSIVLTVNLRLQTSPVSRLDFPKITPGTAFTGYVIAQLLLFLVAFNFMG